MQTIGVWPRTEHKACLEAAPCSEHFRGEYYLINEENGHHAKVFKQEFASQRYPSPFLFRAIDMGSYVEPTELRIHHHCLQLWLHFSRGSERAWTVF
jgi:hypothetical protein